MAWVCLVRPGSIAGAQPAFLAKVTKGRGGDGEGTGRGGGGRLERVGARAIGDAAEVMEEGGREGASERAREREREPI